MSVVVRRSNYCLACRLSTLWVFHYSWPRSNLKSVKRTQQTTDSRIQPLCNLPPRNYLLVVVPYLSSTSVVLQTELQLLKAIFKGLQLVTSTLLCFALVPLQVQLMLWVSNRCLSTVHLAQPTFNVDSQTTSAMTPSNSALASTSSTATMNCFCPVSAQT